MALKRKTHWDKKKPKKRKKVDKNSASYLKKRADNVYSLWLRTSFADKHGNVECYTCGTVKPIKQMQCGHYISRVHNSLRYDPRNTKVQCPSCNIWKQGNLDEFALHLIKDYGPDILEELNKEKQRLVKRKADDYRAIIEKYTLVNNP